MYRVLIADDELSVCKGLRILIDWQKCGFEVAGFCGDGLMALEQMSSGEYDLLITDIRMPGLDGIALLRQLEKRKCPGKAMILSAYADFEYARQAMEHGALVYLLKPIGEDTLMDALERVRHKLDAERGGSRSGGSAPDDLIDAALSLIEGKFDGDLSVNALARALYVTPGHLSRAFRARMGVGLNEYIRNTRVEKACRLLRNPNLMIYEVCERVGFKDLDYFTQVFKQVTGMTPSAYRSAARAAATVC